MAAPSRADAAIVVEHTALTCVPIDRYARVAGRTTEKAARADLQFRVDPAGGWYAVRMTEHGGEWSAFLPRPTSGVRQIEYRIVMTGPDATAGTTPPVTVPVRESAACAASAQASVEAPIVITVPAGAPAVPPVPPGFSPAGVVVPQERTSLSRKLKLAGVVASAAVLGGTAAGVAGAASVASAASERDRPPPSTPSVFFRGTWPAPGSTIVTTRDQVVIVVALGRSASPLLALAWTVQFQNDTAELVCVTMSGRETATFTPGLVELTGPLMATVARECGTRFDSDSIHITLSHDDAIFYSQSHAGPFRFQR